MDAFKNRGKSVAIVAGILTVVAILVVSIVTLVMVNRTQAEVEDLTTKNATQKNIVESRMRALDQAVGQQQRLQRPSPVRAAVMGSMPGGIPSGGTAGAPYKSATDTKTHGVPFPTLAAKSGRNPLMSLKKDSIWSDPLPSESDAAYKGARARQSGGPLGGNFALSSNKELFNRTPDELDARDIDVAKDAFPAPDNSKPTNGHEAIAAMYNFENFRAAMDRNSFTGYLAPVYDRQGWSKLGDRDMCLWKEQMAALRDEFPKNMSIEELMDSQMVPVPDQFYDFFYDAAEKRGVDGIQYDCGGMGGYASGRLYEALEKEWKEGKAAPRPGAGEAAQIMRGATQNISLTDAQAALRAIHDIAGARAQAEKDEMTLPEPSNQQLQALANWSASSTPVRSAALALAKAMEMPLPPASY